ncbi:MAG TPA: DNA alkylation repair protein [Spirochaetota bacterium]|nr:DNA alkylation repair protein [Spirochaetota bacterium]
MSLAGLKREIRKHADPVQAKNLMRFFKTGPGEYGEGDRFLGISVPVQRAIALRHRDLTAGDAAKLLASKLHEERLIALMLLLERYRRGDDGERKKVIRLYLSNTVHVNNWDLVDLSAPGLLGAFLTDRDRAPLYRLARSASLWERRIAIISTLAFIRNGDPGTTFDIAEMLLADEHDLIHKAVGWMLREAGKRDRAAEMRFLDRHAAAMPRTMLRYAIEKFPEKIRRAYLAAGRVSPRAGSQPAPRALKKSR